MATKKEGNEQLTADKYAYVPDPESPSTWKLRIDDAQHVAAAVAALGKGFRGNKVEIPEQDLAAVKRKVAAAYRKFFPDNEVPEVLKALQFSINGQEIQDQNLWKRLVHAVAFYFKDKEMEEEWVKEAEKEAEEELAEEGMIPMPAEMEEDAELAENGLISKSLNEELMQGTFVVLEPEIADLHGDIYSEDEVRKACHNFNQYCEKAYVDHAVETEDAKIVESYIAPSDLTINGVNVVKGTWLQVWQFNEALWQVVKSDSKIGVSIGGYAKVEEL